MPPSIFLAFRFVYSRQSVRELIEEEMSDLQGSRRKSGRRPTALGLHLGAVTDRSSSKPRRVH